MRICFVYPGVYGEFPDIFEYTSKLASLGYQVSFFGFDPEGKEKKYSNMVYVQHVRNGPFSKQAVSWLSNNQQDIVHVFHFRGAWRLGAALSTSKLILDVRTLHVGDAQGNTALSGVKDYITLLESLFFNQVLALTEKIKRKLRPNPRPIEVVPLGTKRMNVDKQLLLNAKQEVFSRLGLNDDEKSCAVYWSA